MIQWHGMFTSKRGKLKALKLAAILDPFRNS